MTKMKAFVMKGIGSVGIMEKDIPMDPGPNEAVVRTTKALVCTSDVHTVGGGVGPRENMTLGHEAVGVVEKVGSEVRGFRQRRPGCGERHHTGLHMPQLPEGYPSSAKACWGDGNSPTR